MFMPLIGMIEHIIMQLFVQNMLVEILTISI